MGGVCSDLCFSDSLLLFSAVTKVYISSFSYLCRRPNLQNGFSVLLVFFENESIKRLIASVYTEEPAVLKMRDGFCRVSALSLLLCCLPVAV